MVHGKIKRMKGINILFIHSAGKQSMMEGSYGLISSLRKSLHLPFTLHAPAMPEPENPRYKNWKLVIEKHFNKINGSIILIGHSLGGSVLLKFLSEEKIKIHIAAMFLISTPYWGMKNWEIDEFTLHSNFENNLPDIPDLFLYHSHKDQWVPFLHMLYYKEKFPNAEIRILEGSDHNFSNGIPQLITDIFLLEKVLNRRLL